MKLRWVHLATRDALGLVSISTQYLQGPEAPDLETGSFLPLHVSSQDAHGQAHGKSQYVCCKESNTEENINLGFIFMHIIIKGIHSTYSVSPQTLIYRLWLKKEL